MNAPILNTSTHRLTSILGVLHPLVCQQCGGSATPGHGNGIMRLSVDRWQEHDHHDRPENLIVCLCNVCSKRMIEPHPRLYSKLDAWHPWPGCMDLCVDCKLRHGIRCTAPDAKANGGAGVMLTIPKPINAMVDGARYSGPLTMWTGPVSECRQKVKI